MNDMFCENPACRFHQPSQGMEYMKIASAESLPSVLEPGKPVDLNATGPTVRTVGRKKYASGFNSTFLIKLGFRKNTPPSWLFCDDCAKTANAVARKVIPYYTMITENAIHRLEECESLRQDLAFFFLSTGSVQVGWFGFGRTVKRVGGLSLVTRNWGLWRTIKQR